MKNATITLTALATGIMYSGMAQSAPSFMIDNFTAPPEGQAVTVTGSGMGGPNTVSGLSNTVGGSRTMLVNVTQSEQDLSSTLTVKPSEQGTLSFSNDSGQNATATVLWDAAGAGLGGTDITVGGTQSFLQTKIIDSDLDLGFRVDITETSAAGGSTAFFTTNLGPGISFVSEALSNFENAGDVDFTQVDSIMLTLTGPDAQDSSLELVEVTGTVIPEPASAAMAGVGLAGLLISRRRRR